MVCLLVPREIVYLLWVYTLPGTCLTTGSAVLGKTDMVLFVMESSVQCEKTEINQITTQVYELSTLKEKFM